MEKREITPIEANAMMNILIASWDFKYDISEESREDDDYACNDEPFLVNDYVVYSLMDDDNYINVRCNIGYDYDESRGCYEAYTIDVLSVSITCKGMEFYAENVEHNLFDEIYGLNHDRPVYDSRIQRLIDTYICPDIDMRDYYLDR